MYKVLWYNIDSASELQKNGSSDLSHINIDTTMSNESVVLYIISYKINAIIVDSTNQELISFLVKENEYFPILCYLKDEKTEQFPKDINPFKCLTKAEFSSSTFNSLKKIITTYNEQYKLAENNSNLDATNVKEFLSLSTFDDIFHKMNWSYSNKKQRPNLINDNLDTMLDRTEEILNNITNLRRKKDS